MNIFPAQSCPNPGTSDSKDCPAWCGGHIPTDGQVVHISPDRTVRVSSPCGQESTELYAALEQAGDGPVAVRLEGASSAPMTPAQAMTLAATLQALAFAAVAGERVAR